jgi:hypothetical protein
MNGNPAIKRPTIVQPLILLRPTVFSRFLSRPTIRPTIGRIPLSEVFAIRPTIVQPSSNHRPTIDSITSNHFEVPSNHRIEFQFPMSSNHHSPPLCKRGEDGDGLDHRNITPSAIGITIRSGPEDGLAGTKNPAAVLQRGLGAGGSGSAQLNCLRAYVDRVGQELRDELPCVFGVFPENKFVFKGDEMLASIIHFFGAKIGEHDFFGFRHGDHSPGALTLIQSRRRKSTKVPSLPRVRRAGPTSTAVLVKSFSGTAVDQCMRSHNSPRRA